MPPAALTPSLSPTVLRIKATSCTVAPPAANPVDVLRLMAMALNGNHVNDPQIIYTKTRYLKVELLDDSKDKEPIPVNLDGEIGGHLPIDFENLKQHIEFYVG